MELTIQRRKKYMFENDYYYEYATFELETYRWNRNHEFEYVRKGSNRWEKLEDNEELVGLK